MDGVLVIDKPAGPTSHDVVARIRRALGESRIGHTGTLDPAATGVLALVLGRATRLAQFLTDSDKSYDAVVRFGFATDTADAQGRAIGTVSTKPLPSRDDIDAALDAFRGTFLQQPPAFSAKKIGGKRSHKLARARARDAAADARLKPSRDDEALEPSRSDLPDPPDRSVLPAPSSVTAYRLDIVSSEADCVTLRLDCSAGFYVRSLAHDLGERLGVGAHLVALRRTRVGDFTIDRALALDRAERDPAEAAAAIVPMADVLPRLPPLVLTAGGVRRARNGCELGPADSVPTALASRPEPHAGPTLFRLLDAAGNLVGVARPTRTAGLLHPCVILG
jgi:tRNA pseudouridine55 synthase